MYEPGGFLQAFEKTTRLTTALRSIGAHDLLDLKEMS